jgi:hypothetical protein
MHFIGNDEVLIGLNRKELKLLSSVLAHFRAGKKVLLSPKDDELLDELSSLFRLVEVPPECGCGDCQNFDRYD